MATRVPEFNEWLIQEENRLDRHVQSLAGVRAASIERGLHNFPGKLRLQAMLEKAAQLEYDRGWEAAQTRLDDAVNLHRPAEWKWGDSDGLAYI